MSTTTPAIAAEPLSRLTTIEQVLNSGAPLHQAAAPLGMPPDDLLAFLVSAETRGLLSDAADFLALRDRYRSLLLRARLLDHLDHALESARDTGEILRTARVIARYIPDATTRTATTQRPPIRAVPPSVPTTPAPAPAVEPAAPLSTSPIPGHPAPAHEPSTTPVAHPPEHHDQPTPASESPAASPAPFT